ncbi:hypothetical protein [Streptosporangium sp. NPDC002721]|uniref:hypothetical protein n=1 Tax=Streptosporangium sp. NPDC002721 TaxID=3366188 RepID=UPI0036CED31F
MSVFCEYYRAVDRAAATVQPDRSRVIDDPEYGVAGFDAVETKWVDPRVILGQLVAFVGGVDFFLGLVDTVPLYPSYPDPAPQTDEEWDALPEDSPYLGGAAIDELPVNARDILAGADDSSLPAVAERWAKIEEFSPTPRTTGSICCPWSRILSGWPAAPRSATNCSTAGCSSEPRWSPEGSGLRHGDLFVDGRCRSAGAQADLHGRLGDLWSLGVGKHG